MPDTFFGKHSRACPPRQCVIWHALLQYLTSLHLLHVFLPGSLHRTHVVVVVLATNAAIVYHWSRFTSRCWLITVYNSINASHAEIPKEIKRSILQYVTNDIMSYTLGYLSMNHDNIREYTDHGSLVTVENVCLERRVSRGRHWSPKWRDNIDSGSMETPKPHLGGTIIGYVDANGLTGQNTGREYNQVQQGQREWCVVEWDNGKRSVYPIGAEGIYALSYID